MKKSEQQLILDLSRKKMDCSEFLMKFRESSDPVELVSTLLHEAITLEEPLAVEYAVILGFTVGFNKVHVELLLKLLLAEYHFKHEDIVRALERLPHPKSIESLLHVTEWVPDYLEFDETCALATKAVWAISYISGENADQALLKLSTADDPIISKLASRLLLKRKATS